MLLLQLLCLTLADLALHLQQQLNEIPYMPHMPYKVYMYIYGALEGAASHPHHYPHVHHHHHTHPHTNLMSSFGGLFNISKCSGLGRDFAGFLFTFAFSFCQFKV